MSHLDFVNTSLRLRYEAFSKFATKVNQADNLQEIGEAIAANLKFVLDVFIFRFATVVSQETYTFELFRGKCTVNTQDVLSTFESNCLEKGLPLSLTRQDIQREVLLHDSLFDHPKVTHLIVLPINASHQQQLVLSVASKNGNAYTEIDFRFVRLIEELLSTKISQLLLIQKIASKNLALAHANQQLSSLNEEVQLLNAQLETKVKERTFRLQETHKELHTLLYRTSHDFRRPLTSMLGLAQLFKLSQSPEETTNLTRHLETTVTGLDNMLFKLQTLMLTETDGECSVIDFSVLIETTKQKFQQELTENHINFSYQIIQQKSYLSHSSIHQAILENLLENAIHYCTTNDPFVQLRVEEENSRLVIQMIDNGDGISEPLQATVFDMYVKASARTQGSGLGLFVVRKLTEALGGTVSVVSQLNRGSTFTVTLPLEKKMFADSQ